MVVENKICNGKYQLIYSKRVILANEEPIKFFLTLDDGTAVNLFFIFTYTDSKKPGYKVVDNSIEGGFQFEISLENFTNSIGTGLINPITILQKNKDGITKSINLAFYSYKHDKAYQILDIALYEEM